MKKEKQLLSEINKLEIKRNLIDDRLMDLKKELKEQKKNEIITICQENKITINDLKKMLKNNKPKEEKNIDYENN